MHVGGQELADSAAMSSSPPPALTYRERLSRLYRVYAPEKLKNVESALFAYGGREEEMMKVATAKYGPEPTDLFYDLYLASQQPNAPSVSDSGDAPVELRSSYSERLMWLFLTYCPEKLLLFDDVLYAYRSDPQQMINDFVKEFGPEPQVDYRKQRLKRFYEYYCPEKVSSVDQILIAYASDPEEKLFDDLKRKYGPEPSPYCAGTSDADKERLQKVQRGRDAAAPTDREEQLNPVALSRDQSEAFTKSRLVDFYKYYCPQKLPFVDSILETYKMHPRGVRQLFFLLEEKYGPEPSNLASSSPLAEGSSDTVSKISGSDRYSALSDVTTMLSPRNFNNHNLPVFGGEPAVSLVSTYPADTSIPTPPVHVRPEDLGQLSDRLFRMVLFYDASRLQDFYSVMPFLTAVDAAQQLQVWTQYHGPEPSETALMDVHRLISSKEAAEAVVRRVHHPATSSSASNNKYGGASLLPSSSASPLLHAQTSFQIRDPGDSSTSLPSSYGVGGGHHRGGLALSMPSSRQSPERGGLADDDAVIPPASLIAAPSRTATPVSQHLNLSSSNILHVTVTQPDGATSTSNGSTTVFASTAAAEPPLGASVLAPPRRTAIPRPRRQLSISTTSPFPYALYLAAQRTGSVKTFMAWWRYNHLADGGGIEDDDDASFEAVSIEDVMAAIADTNYHSEMSSMLDDRGLRLSMTEGLHVAPARESSAAVVATTPSSCCPWRQRAEPVLLQIRVMAVAGLGTAECVPDELRSQNMADVVHFVLPFWIEESDNIKTLLYSAMRLLTDDGERDSLESEPCTYEDQLVDALMSGGDSRVQGLLASFVKQLPGHGGTDNANLPSLSPSSSRSALSAMANIGVIMSQQLASQALRYLVTLDLIEECERKHRYLGGARDAMVPPLPSLVEEEERAWRRMRRQFVDGVLDIVRLDHLYRLVHAEVMLRDGVVTSEDFQRSAILLSWSRCVYLSHVVPEGSPWRWGTQDADTYINDDKPPQHIAAAIWGDRDQLSNTVDAQWNVFTKPIFETAPGSSHVSKLQLQLRTPRPASTPRRIEGRASPAQTTKAKQRVLNQSKIVATHTAELYNAAVLLSGDPRVGRFRARQAAAAADRVASASPTRPRYESPTRRVAGGDGADLLRDVYAPIRFNATLRSSQLHNSGASGGAPRTELTHNASTTPRRPTIGKEEGRGSASTGKPLAAIPSRKHSGAPPHMTSSSVPKGHFSLYSNFSVAVQ
jgi:hypothetical protein